MICNDNCRKMGSMLKSKKKNIPKSVNEMSKEMLHETLKKKKKCNAKAQETVEKLCEENVNEEWLLENLQYINQCHFDDVTIERAIAKICGYPLCDQKLGKIPAQQYHISTRYNKVFDITERKNFCSNCCYKSATYIKKQLFTSPLWFRDQEIIPKYTVLKSSKSSMGEEIVFFPNKIKQEEDLIKNDFLGERMNELAEKCSNLAINDPSKIPSHLTEATVVKNIADSENNEKINVFEKKVKEINENFSKNKTISDVDVQYAPEKTLTISKSDVNKTEKKIKEVPINVVSKVEKCIFEWFSLDTLFYLYTEEKLKELFQDEALKIKQILNSKLSVMRCNENIDKMIQLYGLLDSNLFSSNENETKSNLKPLPNYSILKREGKTLEIKVRAFYQGQLEVKPLEKEETKETETETDSTPMYLPLIDAHAQHALRRKIVLDKLNRVLPELIRVFNADYILQMSEVRNLVTTFILAAHNITFKPREWCLVGIIIIKLLCIKNKQLEKILESSKSQLCLILTSYELQENYLDDLILKLTDGTKLVEKLTDK